MVLGLFEGANESDFGDAVSLFIVSESPTQNVLTTRNINCSRGFRYVRYVGPVDAKCNLSELQFWGYKGWGSDLKLPQFTNIPTVSIHTTNAEDIVDKDLYLTGIVSIVSENGTKVFTDSMDIKGRGNASWSFPKKPYRFKLRKKASLLGLPAVEKDWTLINNYGDKTLMRNLLAFDLSKRLELAYTPAGKPVDLVLNGEYKGTYQLCDQIEVATNRVDVEKMKIIDVNLPELSGGYLLEMDAYANQEISWFQSSSKKIPVTIKYPEDDEIVSAQTNYIKSQFDLMESAVFSQNYNHPTLGYRKYMDTKTFIRHFLIGEITGNTDTYWSTYVYKKRDNDLFYFGPVWDFDIAYDNDNRTYPINNNANWIFASTGSSANGVRGLVNRLMSDTKFMDELKATYATYRNNGTISKESLVGVVDSYSAELNLSQSLNFKRWNILNTIVHQNPVARGTYAKEVDNVRNYIMNRISWMDNKLSYVPNAINQTSNDRMYAWSEKNVLHVEGLAESSAIKVFDLRGQVMYEKSSEDQNITIHLPAGVYVLKVITQSAKIESLKCMVR